MSDHLNVHTQTVSEVNASNTIVSTGLGLLHKITLNQADGSAAISCLVYDAATATGTAKAALTTSMAAAANTFERYVEVNFNPPLAFEVGYSTTITGTGTMRSYFTRG